MTKTIKTPGKNLLNYINHIKMSFISTPTLYRSRNWVSTQNLTKTQVKPILAFFLTKPQTCPPPSVPPVPESIFPQRGEQCPVEKCSYKGYSPLKCTCNAMYKNCYKTKDFFFINHFIGQPSKKFTRKPSDQVHGTTLRCQNILNNPPIKFMAQFSDIKTYWTTL